jgi:hypothetical protein|tara:strand:+ start:4921 stop:5274 length:354 start_codon:yes stop_codon:yes gene_type:complete
MSHPSAIAIFPAVGRVAERRLAALDEVACMTEAMMALAEESDWEALPEAQAARDAALRACFSAPLTEDDALVAADKIQRLLRQNEALVGRVTEAKRRLSQDMQRTKQDYKAVRAYLA